MNDEVRKPQRGKPRTTTKLQCDKCGRLVTFTKDALRKHRSAFRCYLSFQRYLHLTVGRPEKQMKRETKVEKEARMALIREKNRERVAKHRLKKK